MPNSHPTNGELNLMLESLKEHVSEQVTHVTDSVQNAKMQLTESINRVETQVIKTNGRVTNLEYWRALCIGGIAVVMALVIPLVIYVWQTSQGLDKRVSEAIEHTIDTKWQQ